MPTLINKHIILGISGGIAAYKAAELTRLLKQAGAEVRVVMTAAAQQFITPLTLQALSGNPVHTSLLDPAAEAAMGHIELARWADLIVIAPASANLIARLRQGQADDLLTTLYLASNAPLLLAPAMNQAMWRHPATADNIAVLQQRGAKLIGPATGEQACGDIGPGRMEQPQVIADACADYFQSGSLSGKRVVITAGPTREAVDPVRYISNHSSGKMGFALATAAVEAGAEVTLIAGPCQLATPAGVNREDVISAEQMLAASLQAATNCDLFIAAAAVADYRPAAVAAEKLKKQNDQMQLSMVKNPDIVSTVAALPERPWTVGFAAETERLETHARAKLQRKQLDMIIANDVSRQDIGFNSEQNAVTVYWAQQQRDFTSRNKSQLARELIQLISEHLPGRN